MDSVSPRGGIIRAPRRPPQWIPPGPLPAQPQAREDEPLWPGPSEDLCWLAGNWRILQRRRGHRFSLDDVVTAYFASCVSKESPRSHLDLGCGIGSVLLFLAWRFPTARSVGIEAQAMSASMARRSIAWNQVQNRCEVRTGDFRDPATRVGLRAFDLITGTPPYFPRGTGVEAHGVQKAPCRFEHRGGIEDYCLAAAPLLGPGAPFVACAPATDHARVRQAASRAGLSIERWRDVIPRAGKGALFSVFAMRRTAEAGRRVDEPPLVVRDEKGKRTDAFVAVRVEMGMPP